jgi:hypothetical protein
VILEGLPQNQPGVHEGTSRPVGSPLHWCAMRTTCAGH